MKIIIGNDHAINFEDKTLLIDKIIELGYEVENVGTNETDSVDYPDYAKLVCEKVDGVNSMGIVICGSGIGISIAANKCKGIRCALCHNAEYARLARLHNDANVLALGARFTSIEEMVTIIKVFMTTHFEGGRHQNRVNKIEVNK